MADTKKTTKKTTAAKPVAVRKTASVKTAMEKTKTVAKKAAVKSVCAKKSAAPKKGDTLTRILSKIDAGWGNQLYIRGNGGGLSWEKGVLMQCISDDEWLWEKKIDVASITFKILINDEIWSVGEDCMVPVGETAILTPCFVL